MKAIYFGSSPEMIVILNNHLILNMSYTKKSKNLKLINMCEWYCISHTGIKSRDDIHKLKLPYTDVGNQL